VKSQQSDVVSGWLIKNQHTSVPAIAVHHYHSSIPIIYRSTAIGVRQLDIGGDCSERHDSGRLMRLAPSVGEVPFQAYGVADADGHQLYLIHIWTHREVRVMRSSGQLQKPRSSGGMIMEMASRILSPVNKARASARLHPPG
jgi:hypothetical protein